MNHLDAWEAQHRGNASTCWTKVMERWLADAEGEESHDYPATWEGLCGLLSDAEFMEVAENLREAVTAANDYAMYSN